MLAAKPDIVIFALPRWDGSFSSTALSLALELSKSARVFYIENPFTVKDVITDFFKPSFRKRLNALFFGIKKYNRIDSSNENFVNVTPYLTLPINFLPAGKLYNFLNRINNLLVSRSLASVIKSFEIKKFIFINSYNPFYFRDVSAYKPICSIYHCVDNISESKYIGKHGSSFEREVIIKSDLTIATSRKLFEYASGLSKAAYCLPNAADFNLFQQAPNISVEIPLETMSNKMIIGYIGSIDHRVDYNLLRDIVITYPDWFLLLVGPLSEDFNASELKLFKNVLTTGSKPLCELPSYVRLMNCGIIPFVCNKLTESIYPLKLNEYLSLGIPVVSTNFSIDLEDFSDVIKITDSQFDFVRSLQEEIDNDSEDKRFERMKKASSNTWESRVSEFWRILEEYEQFEIK